MVTTTPKPSNKFLTYLLSIFFKQKLGYLAYLETFDRLFDIPKDKKNQEYKR